MRLRYRYQYLIVAVVIESLILDWLIFYQFSQFTRLQVISEITALFITVEGILVGLSPQIKVPYLRDMVAAGVGIPALLTSVGTFAVSTYNSIQFGTLSANSITYYYFDPAVALFLLLVEFYALAVVVPVEKPQQK